MRTIRYSLILLCVLGLGTGTAWLAGCGGDATKSAEAACSCDQAKAGDAGWCEKCSVGYVKGEKTTCKGCVDAAMGGEPCAECAKKGGAKGGSLIADTTGEGAVPGAAAADAFVGEGECKGDCANCKNKDCPCKLEKKSDGKSSEVACVCAKGKAGEPVWCKACNVGYVDGKKADCPGCVDKALKKLEAAKSPD